MKKKIPFPKFSKGKVMKVKKRDGTIVDFEPSKISDAIFKAITATGQGDGKRAEKLSNRVVKILNRRFKKDEIPQVEQIQDIVEEVLILDGLVETARAYILYREQRRRIREAVKVSEEAVDRVDQYLEKLDWEVQENANMAFSLQGLNHYGVSYIVKRYWLNKIYPKEIREAVESGDLHLHNLDTLATYTFFGREVVVVKLNDQIKLLSLKNLYEETPRPEILLNEKDEAFAKYPENLYVLDKNGWVKVLRMVRKKKEREMRFIKSEQGRSVIVTDNHPFIVKKQEDARQEEIEAKKVQEKKDLILSWHIPSLLSKEKLFFRKYLYLAEELLNRGHQNFFLEGFECQDFIKNWGGSLKAEGTLSTANWANSLDNKLELTEDLGYLVGLFIAEGSYSGWRLTITVGDGEIIERIKRICAKLGVRSYVREKEGTRDTSINCSTLKFVFEKIFQIKPLSRNKNLPPDILTYNLDFVRGVIAGLIDGDGSLGTKNKNGERTQILIRLSSRTLLEQLAILLQFFRVISRDRVTTEDIGKINIFRGKKIIQNYPIYGISFSKKKEVVFPSFKYRKANSTERHWRVEKYGWNRVLENKVTTIPDDSIYDITTYSKTFLCNSLLVHNCSGWDLYDLLLKGFGGVSGKMESKPPKHFEAALGQAVNFIYTLAGEVAGAVSFSNFDTLLAPFIRYDKLNYQQVKQALQEFLFNMATPTRVGFQCLSEDTEILTLGGWRRYDEIKEGDEIKTLNLETKKIENKKVSFVFKRKYKGMMYRLRNRIQDQLISPEHRVLRRKFSSEKYVLEPIEDVLELKSPIIIPIAGKNPNPEANISDEQIKLMAWIISEGTVERPGKHRCCHRVSIYQSKIKNRKNYDEIINLLRDFNLVYANHPATSLGGEVQQIRLNAEDSRKIHQWFGTRENVHFIPDDLLNLSERQSRLFLETFLKGEGTKEWKIATSDLDLLDSLQTIIVNSGYGFTVSKRNPTAIGKKNIYILRIIRHPETYITKIKKVNYEGIIWCPHTGNGTVIARRKGKVFITGNCPFSNLTLDLRPSPVFAKQPVIIGGRPQKETYREFEEEMKIFDKAFYEAMLEGDKNLRPFSFPIPTINITKDFPWQDPAFDGIFEASAKYGTNYFANYINSDMSPDDVRSMCCRIRLDLRELYNRGGGGLFGSGSLTGSIGVVTIGLPRIGYLAKTKKDFFERLRKVMDLAKESLEIKRKTIENFIEKGLYPYSKFYLSAVKKMRGGYYANHFSTIGLVGMNEALLNFIGEDIGSRQGRRFALEVLDFMREKLVRYQKETDNIYNLEATPAESTAYRLALKDREKYPDIISAGTKETPYYTNSSQLPVNYTDDIFDALKLQDELQCKYTGGCIEKGNKVLTDKGLLPIENIVKDFEKLKPIKTISYNPEKRISEWDEIVEAVPINVKRHNKIRIKGERNLDIVTSDWHPFFVLEKFRANPACPICEEKVINLKSFAAHIYWHPECQKKYQEFPKYQVKEKRADELRVGDYILQNSTNLYSEEPSSKLNDELMWLIGFFIGDGSISKFIDNRGGNKLERYKVRFFSEHQEALEKVAKILNRYFGCDVNVIRNEKRGNKLLKEVTSSKKDVSNFFFKYDFKTGKKRYTVSIPQRVKENIDKNNVYALLSGLMDSDGHIDKAQGDFEYYTVSSQLADDILELCSCAGIMISKKEKPTKRKNEVNIYRLRIPKYQITKIRDRLTNTVNNLRIRRDLSNRKKRYFPVVRVKEVSRVNVKDNQFYDLMTKKNHNYLAGKNTLVFIHNTVLHLFLGEKISEIETAKNLVKKVFENFHLPYLTLTPTFSICPHHGYLAGEHFYCPKCTIKQPCEVYSRVVGYLRPVQQWHVGKRQEFKERKEFKLKGA